MGCIAYEYLEKVKKEGNGGYQRLYIPKILPEIKQIDNASYESFVDHLNRLHPRLVTNMIENPKDADVAMKIRRSCEEYLGIKIEHLGIIYRDSLQDISLASRLPITLYKPSSVLSQAIYRIADKILQSDEVRFSITDKEINESFLETGAEAVVDFESKMEYMGDLLHSGVLSHGDLIETVKTQQLEINKLKKENNFLKTKLAKALKQGFKV